MKNLYVFFVAGVATLTHVSLLDASQVSARSHSSSSSYEVPFSIIVEDGQSRAHTLPRVIVRGASYTAAKAHCVFARTNTENAQQSKIYHLDDDICTILKQLFFPAKQIEGKGTETKPYVYTCDASQDLEYAAAVLVATCAESGQVAELSLESVQKILEISQQRAQQVCEYLWFRYVISAKALEDDDEEKVELWEDFITALHVCLLKIYTSQMKEGGKTISQLKKYFEARDEEFLKLYNKPVRFKPFAEDLFDHLKGKELPLKFEKSDMRDSKKGASLKTPPTRGSSSEEGSLPSSTPEATPRSGRPDRVLADDVRDTFSSSEEGSLPSSTPEATPRSGRPDRVLADDVRDTFSSRGKSRVSPPRIVVERIVEEEHSSQINLGEYTPVESPRHGNQSDVMRRQDSCLMAYCRRYRKTAITLGALVLGGLGIGVWKACQAFA